MLGEGLEVLGSEGDQTDGERQCGAFAGSALETVRLPSTLRVIGRNAFRGCRYLRGIALPEGLERIGQTAFADSGLRSLACPGSLRTVGQGAFYMCRGLVAVALNEGLEVLDTGEAGENGLMRYGVFQCCAVESLRLPSTLKGVWRGAFAWGDNPKRVEFAEGTESLGDGFAGLFSGSGVREVVLPGTLREVSSRVFEGCQGL